MRLAFASFGCVGFRTSGDSPVVRAAVVVVACAGLLLMHGLQVLDTASAMPGPERVAATGTVLGSVRMTLGDEDHAPMGEHPHRLLGCLWLIAAGIVLFVALFHSGRRTDRIVGLPRHFRAISTTQRAPPVATRLSLVGVSRR